MRRLATARSYKTGEVVMEIDGRSRVIVHLAYPSAHLLTPTLFNARCLERRINAVLVPWEVAPADLGAAWAGLKTARSLAGAIVTIPHKESAASHCDALEGAAADLNVANVIRRDAEGRMTGRLYDGEGFVAGLCAHGYEPLGKRTLLLGAGGAATALAQALLTAGVSELVIANRNIDRGEALAARLRALNPGRPIGTGPANARGFDLVVNSTSVGLDGDPASPVDTSTIEPGCMVADIVMKPAMTPLLRGAEARGARIHQGVHMLAAQIDLFVDFLLDEGSAAAALRPSLRIA
ncbi:shikimate dehydrogenase family protein [Methylobacterium nodulans]|uniref:shikimate dehydrogenase (NADP(+)) n=1 Tax=Methylobacterium nodulans (strain LMG 21967 / CNCM I-2342 / ORS 2060) TaxID=460265 RepID=B8IQI8_METNO|nr:shikimate dehydrogenase [Methylobacterium nodulans]ACL60500.1 Shikimate/quinate 5-dehydrogenase [Methylobacterium nodulans ORS 2060]